MTEQPNRKEALIRILFIIVFAFIFHIAHLVAGAVSLAQCLFTLISGAANTALREFGNSLGHYMKEIVHYVTFENDEKPFPFSDFPKSDSVIEAQQITTDGQ